MYPHPRLNSFLHGCNPKLSIKILDHAVNKATIHVTTLSNKYVKSPKFPLTRLISTQPGCFGPNVDVSRARCGYGSYALPQLIKQLRSNELLVVRQAITTLGDLLVDPEKSMEALDLNIAEELTDFLVSHDAYLRERVAMIYLTLSNQSSGRNAITANVRILSYFLKNLQDKFAAVRLKAALVLEMLSQEVNAAKLLTACGFLKLITEKLDDEKYDILLVHLDTMKWLLRVIEGDKGEAGGAGTMTGKSIGNEIFERLTNLLEKNDERIIQKALICLTAMCEGDFGKRKANDADLLKKLKKFAYDKRESLRVEALRVASFVTITTVGKLRALELEMTNRLLYLATKKPCPRRARQLPRNDELLLVVIKTLTNIAEVPAARSALTRQYDELIENIDVGESELLQRHKQILLDVIRWRA